MPLKNALMAHPKWPDLKVPDWEELARPLLNLEKKMGCRDRRYNIIKMFCQNALKKVSLVTLNQD